MAERNSVGVLKADNNTGEGTPDVWMQFRYRIIQCTHIRKVVRNEWR